LNESKVPTLATFAGALHTRSLFSPYIFRVTPSTFQYTYEVSKWLAQHGYKGKTFKKVVYVGANFEAPREIIEAYKKGLKEVGGEIVQEFWPNQGSADYGPYLNAIKVDQADAIVAAMWGGDPARFVTQWVEYGLNKQIPIIGAMSFTDEGVTLPAMGVNADGVLSWCVSSPQTDLPENKKFVEGYKSRYKALPGHYAYLAYIAAQAAYEAMEKVKGNVEDKAKFLDALRKVKFTTPMGGKAYFDEKQGMVYDFIFLEARKTNGECHLFEIGRIKDVKEPYRLFP
jgi:branched-chain amino acid transport system substrate-binding protein